MVNSEKLLQLEKYFEKSIRMALEEKLSWPILALLLDNMASTLVECKQLIKMILKELQTIHKNEQFENTHKIQSETGEDAKIEM